MQGYITKRCQDVDEKIRELVIEEICKSALNNPKILNQTLINKIGLRIKDRKKSVRLKAIHYLGKMFAKNIMPYWSDNRQIPTDLILYLTIPKLIVPALTVMKDWQTTNCIEEIIVKECMGNPESIYIGLFACFRIFFGIFLLTCFHVCFTYHFETFAQNKKSE